MWKKASLALLTAVALTACSDKPDVTSKKDEPKTSDAWKDDQVEQAEKNKDNKSGSLPVQPADKQGMPKEAESTGHYYREGLGEIQVEGIGYNDEVGLDGTDGDLKPINMGPMQLLIGKLHVVDMKLDEDAFLPISSDEERVKVIIADMAARNTSEKDISFYPDQAVAVTNTGEQIEPEMLGDDLGGDFLGAVKKEGQVWWVLKDPDEKIESVKLIISGPTDENFDDVGEEKRIEFDILPYKEALKKDKGN